MSSAACSRRSALRSTGSYKEKEWEHIQEEAVGRVPDGVPTEPLLLHGDPAETLAEATSDLDLLVLGSRGYGPVKGTLLGSVSARVMAAASCPVLVVPRGAGRHSARRVAGRGRAGLRLTGMPGAGAAYPAEREAEVVLRDGSTVHVRPVRAEDEEAIHRFLEGLHPESRMFRFFSVATDLGAAARSMVDVDYSRRYGLVAIRDRDGGRTGALLRRRPGRCRGRFRGGGPPPGNGPRHAAARPPRGGRLRERDLRLLGGGHAPEPPDARGLPRERLPGGDVIRARRDPGRAADLVRRGGGGPVRGP